VDLGEQPWLADHVVGDQAILPGTAMLEIAGSACQELFGAFALRDVAFASPMPLSPDAPRAVQLAFDDERGYRLYSRVEGGRWEQHSSGRASSDVALPEVPALDAWRAECVQPLDPSLPYERLESRDIHFGDRF
jgi:acyl transferase domain-containing protein